MRTPPDNLLELLSELRLCTREQVLACEPIVRRLSHDLPDFEMVWLDALVQRNVLTPWQAEILQSPTPQVLRAGRYLKRDRLSAHVVLAEADSTGNLVTLTDVTDAADNASGRFLRHMLDQQERVDEVRRAAPATVVLPRQMIDTHTEQWQDDYLSEGSRFIGVVSDYVPGWNVEELTIRGGRLPWQVVAEVGRELLGALRWMESHSFVHGNIVPRNIRVQPDGQPKLVSPFVARWKQPLRTFTAHLKLSDVQTTAPELVGTGQAPDSRSELYSLGCVLWQLLTARPVFLAADPVNRILKAQQHDIPDVRTLVPDCPDWMGRLIHSLTRRVPELRPESCEQAAAQWSQHTSASLRQTRKLVRKLPDRSQRMRRHSFRADRSRRGRRAILAGVMMLSVTALAGWGVSNGLLPQTLRLSGTADTDREISLSRRLPAHADASEQVNAGLRTLPSPDAAGVILLRSGEVYHASARQFAGVMHIETTADEPALVRLPLGSSWQLQAQQIVLSNVQVDSSDAISAASSSVVTEALHCQCDVLSVNHCVFSSPGNLNTNAGIYWQPLENVTSVVTVSDCVFDGAGYGLQFAQPPQRCELSNVLLTTRGSAVRCDIAKKAQSTADLHLDRVTHVDGRSFLDLVVTSATITDPHCRITCGESVLAPTGTLVRVAGPAQWSYANLRVDFLLPERGNPTIVPPHVQPAAVLDYSLKSLVALGENQIVSESLLVAAPVFAVDSADADTIMNYQLVDYEGPKLSPALPGVQIERLPRDERNAKGPSASSDADGPGR